MGEGVDPTQMCQSLSGQSRSVRATSWRSPIRNLLVLFEDWLEELEAEVQALSDAGGWMKSAGRQTRSVPQGATFLLSKLKREGKR
jgi:hypothetical protein